MNLTTLKGTVLGYFARAFVEVAKNNKKAPQHLYKKDVTRLQNGGGGGS
jgi:hypothetical protein